MEESLQSALVLAQRTADEVKASAHKEADLVKQSAKLELDHELSELRARIADARRELQRQNDHVAAVKQDLRSFLARQASMLEDSGVVQEVAAAPALPMPDETAHEIAFREST
jgi:cell division initiation protein